LSTTSKKLGKKEILGIWREMPIYRLILEELTRRERGLREKELITILKKEYGITVTRRELYQALLRLESNGYVKVDRVGESFLISLSPYLYKVLASRTTRTETTDSEQI